jgi:hypothetical protein
MSKNMLEDLQKLKEAIEEEKANVVRYETTIENLKESLKKDFGLKSFADAEKRLMKLQNEAQKLEKEIEEEWGALKEKYEW